MVWSPGFCDCIEQVTEGVETYGAKESRYCRRLKLSIRTVESELKGKEQDLSNFCDVVWYPGFCDCIEQVTSGVET